MANKRKPLSKKVRFEVFKRDSFSCQYCGKAAPDVILHCDHIHPVSKGGDDDILNLVTSCEACNLGKSDIELSDDTSIKKQQAQLSELNERREQLEMMLSWREGLKELEGDISEALDSAWSEVVPGFHLTDRGIKTLTKLVKKFSLKEVLDAIDTAAEQYIKEGAEGEIDGESANIALGKVGGIVRTRRQPDYMKELYYARGILRNRISYCNDWQALSLMRDAYNAGADVEAIKEIAKEVRNWTEFSSVMQGIINA